MSAVMNEPVVWRHRLIDWIAFAALCALLIVTFNDGLRYMVQVWSAREEYSYGYLIPFITLFLIWQKKEALERIPFTGSWLGVGIVASGVFMLVLGNLSTLYVIGQYALLIVLSGLVLSFTGARGFRVMLVPLFVLAFMIPLPDFLLTSLSGKLQLMSSQLGVSVIRAFGVSVNLEGNVIDLGQMKLQVVEACSGLRYLFPLMTFGFITAYFFKAAYWKRAVIFLSTIPITILMNSFRIGVIGVTVEYWGKSMAEGFLHDFEGWFVFMACTGVLFVEMLVLAKLGKDRRPLREVFGLEFPAGSPANAQVHYRSLPRPFLVAAALLVAVMLLSLLMPPRVELIPQRHEFREFPLNVGAWQGKGARLEQIYVDTLKFDDYVLADFTDGKSPVNLYAAYYGSQRNGQSAHSPRTCMPGGGWEITSLTQRAIADTPVNGQPLVVNRTVIEMGEFKQVVYYWFQQRGRIVTNEYLVKWYLLWDAIIRNRTDGALVRLTSGVQRGEQLSDADRRLEAFAHTLVPQLETYIPN